MSRLNNMYFVIFYGIVISNFLIVSCELTCEDFETCGACIGHAKDWCVWCSAEEHEGRRCQLESAVKQNETWCKNVVYNPQIESDIVHNKDFSAGEDKSPVVQFRPQLMNIKMRPGSKINFTMSYKPAKNYPLDVYYLIDYSFTMKQYADLLKQQGRKIYKELTSLTDNVRLGIGSFVDKPAMPFANPSLHNAFSFKSNLALTNDTTKFEEILKTGTNGSNYDVPEGTLDALMQAIVCKEVGWRDEAWRIIVITTDATYHSAGDGKFVGTTRPHDMKCHMTKGEYSMALTLDYPSVSQINKVATENNTKIIFFTKDEKDYQALANAIQGAKYVPLKNNSNLVDMITKEYLELVTNIQIDSNVPSYMSLSLDPDCSKVTQDNCIIKPTSNEPLTINGVLTVNSCPSDKDTQRFVEIGPLSLKEKLRINLEVTCQCECEKPGIREENSKKCNNFGTYQCGVCDCNEQRYGEKCNCTGSSTTADDQDTCKRQKNETVLCSGVGTCRCGKCECPSSRYSGEYCQFDENNCYSIGGRRCVHGMCKLGICTCNAGWKGDDCNCRDDSFCLDPESKKYCSGNGDCVCGECICRRKTKTSELCSGRFCEDCEEVNAKRCHKIEDFAYCNFQGNLSECEQSYNLTNTRVTFVSHADVNSQKQSPMWCRKLLEDGSYFIFGYEYSKSLPKKLHLTIQKELELPPKANIWVAVGSAIGTVLLIGLITVIAWKILVDLHDKKEYEKFAAESHSSGFIVLDNPLYENPATNFQNPAYGQANEAL